MEAQNSWTIHTYNTEQENALKAFVKALKMKFEPAEKPYNTEFVKKIKESKKQHDDGNYTTVKKDDLKNFLGL